MLKFLLLIVSFQIYLSASDFDSDSYSDSDDERKNLIACRTDAANTAGAKERVLNLPADIIRVHLSVLDEIMGKDNSHLLALSEHQPIEKLEILTALQLQNGFSEMGKLLVEASKQNVDSNAIKDAVSKIPLVMVLFQGGKIKISARVSHLCNYSQNVTESYTPIEKLLIHYCTVKEELRIAKASKVG